MKHLNQRSLFIICSLLLVLGLISGCTTITESASLMPGPDFTELAYVQLSNQSLNEETLGQFTIEEAGSVTLSYILPNIDTAYFYLSLVTPSGKSLTILRSEDYRTDARGGGTWEQELAPGTYQLLLTAAQCSGHITVYWKTQ